jgi:hypothetical protein
LRSRTSASPAKAATVAQAPPWLARLLIPLAARQIAHKFAGLPPNEVAEKMRTELGRPPSEMEARLIDAVVARVPAAQAAAPRGTPPSGWVLVAANVVPLAGVLFWGWDAFPLVALFWAENVVIGVLNALKMLLADPGDAAMWAGKLFMVPFFCVHYGIFTAVHGMFVLLLFGGHERRISGFDVLEPAVRAAQEYGLWLPLAVLAASHVFSFFWNYLHRGEFRRAQLSVLMAQPYARVMVLHVVLLAGGFAATLLGSPVWALLLLIALKTGLDWKAHVKEHSPA